MLTAILLLLVLVPLVVLAVRSVLMIVRLMGAEREAPSHSGGVTEREGPSHSGEVGEREASSHSGEAAEPPEERATVKVAPDASRVCAVCGERVLATARMCRHCGAALSS